MFRVFLLVGLLLMHVPAYAEQSFDLRVKVYGVAELEGARLSLSYSIDRGSAMRMDGNELKLGRDRDRRGQFVVNFDDISLAEKDGRGFVYGEILDTKGSLIRQIPLRPFYAENASERGVIDLDIMAREPGSKALLNSYPPNEKNYVDEENADFVLQSLKVLIDKGYVVGFSGGWERIYQFFLGNASFFKDGSRDRISRVLSFLETIYELERGKDGVNSHFPKFYISFLDTLMKMDIGGRNLNANASNEDGNSLKGYVIARYKAMLLNDPVNVLPEVVAASETLYSKLHTGSCLVLTSSAIKAMSIEGVFISSISFNDQNDRLIKRLMKLLVDCNQIEFEIKKSGEYVDEDNLKDNLYLGFENISGNHGLLTDYRLLFEIMEKNGLFLAKYRKSTFSSVYSYYDYIVRSFNG